MERLQKFLSSAGVTSRRQAEKMILAGRIKVNGQTVKELGVKVDPDTDRIEADGKLVQPAAKLIYLAMYKPAGYITGRFDKFKRKTVYDLLPGHLRHIVWNVGRLDYETEGLLIFTNDGDLTNQLTHPKFEHTKEYEVRLNKPLAEPDQEKLTQGVKLDEFTTSPAKLEIVKPAVVNIIIHEGHKRQVRRMFNKLGYEVLNLKRIREQKLLLKALNLKPGEIKEVSKSDIL